MASPGINQPLQRTGPADHRSAFGEEREGATRAHWRSAATTADGDGEGSERAGEERRTADPPLEPSITSVKIAVHRCLETARCADVLKASDGGTEQDILNHV